MRSDARRLQNRAVLGVLLMVAGLALYPISDAFVKHLTGVYSVSQVSFLRAATRMVPLCCAVFFQGGWRQVFGSVHVRRHLFRLGVNLMYTLTFMYAFSLGSLTSIYTLSYTSPLFMIVLSAWLLRERVDAVQWVAVGVGMAGVVTAMRPGTGVFEWVAVFVLFGTFLGALNKILMRRLAATEHSLAIAIYPNVVMLLAMCPVLFFPWMSALSFLGCRVMGAWEAMPIEHWGLFGIVGVVTAVGQYAIAQALRFTQVSTLAPIDYSSFFWVLSLDYLCWNKIPDLCTVLGATIIVGSNLFILQWTRRNERKKTAVAYPEGRAT